jgi:WhiB family redox-sensing transcriptional regulator
MLIYPFDSLSFNFPTGLDKPQGGCTTVPLNGPTEGPSLDQQEEATMTARVRHPLPPACFGTDPDLWFPLPESDPGERPTSAEARALAICRGCPVLDECRKQCLALDRKPVCGRYFEPSGVCGGMTGAQRRAAFRDRKQVAA